MSWTLPLGVTPTQHSLSPISMDYRPIKEVGEVDGLSIVPTVSPTEWMSFYDGPIAPIIGTLDPLAIGGNVIKRMDNGGFAKKHGYIISESCTCCPEPDHEASGVPPWEKPNISCSIPMPTPPSDEDWITVNGIEFDSIGEAIIANNTQASIFIRVYNPRTLSNNDLNVDVGNLTNIHIKGAVSSSPSNCDATHNYLNIVKLTLENMTISQPIKNTDDTNTWFGYYISNFLAWAGDDGENAILDNVLGGKGEDFNFNYACSCEFEKIITGNGGSGGDASLPERVIEASFSYWDCTDSSNGIVDYDYIASENSTGNGGSSGDVIGTADNCIFKDIKIGNGGDGGSGQQGDKIFRPRNTDYPPYNISPGSYESNSPERDIDQEAFGAIGGSVNFSPTLNGCEIWNLTLGYVGIGGTSYAYNKSNSELPSYLFIDFNCLGENLFPCVKTTKECKNISGTYIIDLSNSNGCLVENISFETEKYPSCYSLGHSHDFGYMKTGTNCNIKNAKFPHCPDFEVTFCVNRYNERQFNNFNKNTITPFILYNNTDCYYEDIYFGDGCSILESEADDIGITPNGKFAIPSIGGGFSSIGANNTFNNCVMKNINFGKGGTGFTTDTKAYWWAEYSTCSTTYIDPLPIYQDKCGNNLAQCSQMGVNPMYVLTKFNAEPITAPDGYYCGNNFSRSTEIKGYDSSTNCVDIPISADAGDLTIEGPQGFATHAGITDVGVNGDFNYTYIPPTGDDGTEDKSAMRVTLFEVNPLQLVAEPEDGEEEVDYYPVGGWYCLYVRRKFELDDGTTKWVDVAPWETYKLSISSLVGGESRVRCDCIQVRSLLSTGTDVLQKDIMVTYTPDAETNDPDDLTPSTGTINLIYMGKAMVVSCDRGVRQYEDDPEDDDFRDKTYKVYSFPTLDEISLNSPLNDGRYGEQFNSDCVAFLNNKMTGDYFLWGEPHPSRYVLAPNPVDEWDMIQVPAPPNWKSREKGVYTGLNMLFHGSPTVTGGHGVINANTYTTQISSTKQELNVTANDGHTATIHFSYGGYNGKAELILKDPDEII